MQHINMDVGAIIHYALSSYHRPNKGVMNYGPYIVMNVFKKIILFHLFICIIGLFNRGEYYASAVELA
jgi:uncharacterized membrane protein